MKLRNRCRGALWLKGVEIPPGEVRDVPGITMPEIKATELRTRVDIVNDNSSSKRSTKKSTKEKAKVNKKEEKKPDTVVRLHDEEEPKVMGELTEEGEVKMYDKPKSVENIEENKK